MTLIPGNTKFWVKTSVNQKLLQNHVDWDQNGEVRFHFLHHQFLFMVIAQGICMHVLVWCVHVCLCTRSQMPMSGVFVNCTLVLFVFLFCFFFFNYSLFFIFRGIFWCHIGCFFIFGWALNWGLGVIPFIFYVK